MTKRELESPFTMTSPVETTSPRDSTPFVKFFNPFTSPSQHFFVGLEPTWSDFNDIEFTGNMPVGHIRKYAVTGKERLVRLKETNHPNLVNLRDVFIADGFAFFVYEKWGISLPGIYSMSPIFQLGEVEVATLCREVLKGLKYIHQSLGTVHGNLAQNIHIMEDGSVKIANIGESMLVTPNSQKRSKDIQGVCDLARKLLAHRKSEAQGVISSLATDFANAPTEATIDELLVHSFLTISTGTWCLRPTNILFSIIRSQESKRG
ncbi:uncharacterized protein BDV14DRAFT_182292 [Aspergillus stella-maris]|uniref:uncharacterized protein n=1 Tax=Aspergillus stella-maris TaxID=1810926 RepID=UPI003CCDD54D